MTSAIKTILVLGGTSGIGEAFARRLHSQGKRVIVSGRRQGRLDALKAELPGLESYTMDVQDFAGIPGHVEQLFATYPDIDTVWVNAGIMGGLSFRDPDRTTDAAIRAELDVNVAAPTLLARHFVPRLLAKRSETNFWITSSGLAFIPVPSTPVYCATKAYVHSFCVAMRQQLAGTSMNVIEIVPPLVDAGVGAGAGSRALSLHDYVEETFRTLDSTPAKELKEVAAGTAVTRAQGWRDGLGPIMKKMGLED